MQPSIPLNLFQQLDEAVSEVFELMLCLSCIPAPLCCASLPGFTAHVRFSGALTGACALHLDLPSAGMLTEQLTGEAQAPDSPLPADTVGELCNMIAGSWKSRLEPALAACQLSSPTTQPSTCTPTEAATITRTYHFHPHCLTLQLTFA